MQPTPAPSNAPLSPAALFSQGEVNALQRDFLALTRPPKYWGHYSFGTSTKIIAGLVIGLSIPEIISGYFLLDHPILACSCLTLLSAILLIFGAVKRSQRFCFAWIVCEVAVMSVLLVFIGLGFQDLSKIEEGGDKNLYTWKLWALGYGLFFAITVLSLAECVFKFTQRLKKEEEGGVAPNPYAVTPAPAPTPSSSAYYNPLFGAPSYNNASPSTAVV